MSAPADGSPPPGAAARKHLDGLDVDHDHVLVSARSQTRNAVYHLPSDDAVDETRCTHDPKRVRALAPERVGRRRVCQRCAGTVARPPYDRSLNKSLRDADPEDIGLSPMSDESGNGGGE